LGYGATHKYHVTYLVELGESRREVHGTAERISLENIEFGLRMHLGTLQGCATGARAY
jgi:hypothetical protein